ncbi:TPA: hypothetical protein NKO30_006758 [Pseudomonas aeruginosa]|nr:hypothetical protein [Pseudomonas aeruginosa]
MTSSHFAQLGANLLELKRVYLSSGAAPALPSAEHQEMARAFLVFAHAELEWYAERICIDLTELVLTEAKHGRFGSPTLALLTFSSLENINGGDSLGGKKAAVRLLTKRVGDASSKHKQLAEANEGVREKHLAKLFVPLGLTASQVDSAWLAELDTFASSRGAFVHMTRSESRASPLAVNPADVWQLCSRLVWGSSAASEIVSSFQELDNWFLGLRSAFGNVSNPMKHSLWKRVLGFFKQSK